MSFSSKEAEFLAFDGKVQDMGITLSKLDKKTIVSLHNRLVSNCEDYQTIGGFEDKSFLVENSPKGILEIIPEGTGEDYIGAMFDPSSFTGGLIRASVLSMGAPYLLRVLNCDTRKDVAKFSPVFAPGEVWNGIVHSLAVFFALRNKTPQEMFPKFFEKEGVSDDNSADK